MTTEEHVRMRVKYYLIDVLKALNVPRRKIEKYKYAESQLVGLACAEIMRIRTENIGLHRKVKTLQRVIDKKAKLSLF